MGTVFAQPQEVPTPQTPNTVVTSPISKMPSLSPPETVVPPVREHDNQLPSPFFPPQSPQATEPAEAETQEAEVVDSSGPLTPTLREDALDKAGGGEVQEPAPAQQTSPQRAEPLRHPSPVPEPAPARESTPPREPSPIREEVEGGGGGGGPPAPVPSSGDVVPKSPQQKGRPTASKQAARPLRLRLQPKLKATQPRKEDAPPPEIKDIYDGGLYWKTSGCIVCPCCPRVSCFFWLRIRMNRYFTPSKSGKPPKASTEALKIWNEKGGCALDARIAPCFSSPR